MDMVNLDNIMLQQVVNVKEHGENENTVSGAALNTLLLGESRN